jgi:hypothetical protein
MTPRSFARVLLRCCVAGFLLGCEHGTAPRPVEPVVLQFCANALPVWVAFQNEGAGWERGTIRPDGTLPLDVTEHVAIATVHSPSGMVATNVRYTSATELKSKPFVQCSGTSVPGAKTVSGSVTGLTGGQNARVVMAQQSAFATGSFTLSTLPEGVLDLVAHRVVFQQMNTFTDRIILRRALDVSNGSTLPVIDFASGEAVSPVTNTVTLSGLTPGELGPVSHAFITANGTNTSFFSINAATQTLTSYSLPAALLTSGDRQLLRIERYTLDPFVGRTTIVYYTVPSDMGIELGAPLATPAITTLSTSPLRFRVRMDRQADYSRSMSVAFTQGGRQFSISVADDYYTTPPAVWEAAMVDFRGVDGWQDTWEFVPGTAVNWSAQGFGLLEVSNGVPVPGSIYRTAFISGSM